MKLLRRLSDPPGSRGGGRCPDVWETDTGDYVVIGTQVTEQLLPDMPATADIGTGEQAVLVPREVLQSALKRINA